MEILREMLPADTFENIEMGAGMLLYDFDPENPSATTKEDVITATTGGVTVVCEPTYSDMGEDVDNCPEGLLELMHLDSWACRLETTALAASADTISFALGAADIEDKNGYKQIDPRRVLRATDAKDIWWAGPKTNGGAVAVCLKNALSSGGYSLKTTKNGKGQTTLSISGHPTVETQDEVPMTFYVFPPKAEEAAPVATYTARNRKESAE